MRASARARRLPGLAGALALVLSTTSAVARPFTIEDFLGREDLGAIEPLGSALVFERRGPTKSAVRFDLDAQQDVERTQLWMANPERTAAPRLLFRSNTRDGYALGPASPDGRHVAVMRLTDRTWELGVADASQRRVHWLGVTPEKTADGETVAWRTDHELVVVACLDGLPGAFRHRRAYPSDAPGLWRATAAGGVATRAFSSGPGSVRRLYRRALLAIDLKGASRTLAEGPIIAFAMSPDRRRAAVVSEGLDHPLSADHPVQGVYGFEGNEHHLSLVDLNGGATSTPAAGWDVLLHPLAWSSDSRQLIAFGRTAVEPWPNGRFLRIDVGASAAKPLQGVRADLDFRPEAARARWLGGDPFVWGMLPGAAEPAWIRVAADGPVRLGADLRIAKDGLTATPGGLLAAGAAGIFRLSQGSAPVLVAPGVQPIGYPQLNRAFSFPSEVPFAQRLIGRNATGALVAVSGEGVAALPALLPNEEILHPSDNLAGLVIRRRPRGGVLELTWAAPTGGRRVLLDLNRAQADLDDPEITAIHHLGPSGEALTSWLLLPRLAPGAAAPPLIVRLYPGARYAAPPSTLDGRTGGADKAAALLAAHGFAVLTPSLPIPAKSEPAQDLAKRVLAIVDQANRDPATRGRFDPERLGVWGQSFGGWGALTLITQTDRFRAAIAESALSDLVSEWGQFDQAYRLEPGLGLSPFFTEGYVEDLQGGMHNPPWADPARYIRNSPVFAADRVNTPILLLHGEQDGFSLGQPEEMFSALTRQNKPAELVAYWGEGHAIASPGSLRDLFSRVLRWFDEHLVSEADAAHPPASPESASANAAPRTRSPRPAGASAPPSDG